MPANNVIASAPTFNPHRLGVSANDSAPAQNNPKLSAGVNGRDFDKAIIDVVLASGTLTSVTLEALYWSDEAQMFVSMNPAETVTINAPGQWIIEHHGRRFFIAVSGLTGAAPALDLNVAGIRSGGMQFA